MRVKYFTQRLAGLTLTLCMTTGLLAAMQTPAAALQPIFADNAKKMGQMTVYHSGTYVGSDAYNLMLDFGGYIPQTVTVTMTGDFTEAEARATCAVRDANPNDYNLQNIAGGFLIYKPSNVSTIAPMFATAISDLDDLNDLHTMNQYSENVYMSDETPTSVTYSIIPPGDLPVKSLYLKGPWYFSMHVLNEKTGEYEPRATTYSTYIDGQLIFSCSVSNGVFSNYKWYTPNFQTTQEESAKTVTPTTSSVFVDGKQVDLGAYLIGGNNYVKLRDIAALLDGTPAQFDTLWRGEENMIELLRGSAYSPQGGELAPLSAGAVTASRSTSKLMYEHEWAGSLNPMQPRDIWPENIPFAPRYPYYTDLHTEERSITPTAKPFSMYVATVPEYFLPTAYNIGGNNFYKLRDIAHIAGFTVEWDEATGSVQITTEKPHYYGYVQ